MKELLKKLLGRNSAPSIYDKINETNKEIQGYKKEVMEWSIDDVLLEWQTSISNQTYLIPWTLGMAYEGLQVFGGTGSGKTSGTAKTVASSMIKAGFGGLVLCAKADEADNWCNMAEEYGRADDVILFSPEAKQGFNFLEYEMTRKGRGAGMAENVVAVMMEIIATGEGGNSDPTWERAMKQLLRNALDLIKLSGEKTKISLIYDIATKDQTQVDLIKQAKVNLPNMTESEQLDVKAVADYFLIEWANMGDKTKSSILMNLTSICDPFLRGSMRDCFCSSSTVTPEEAEKGKIIIVDMAVKEFNELGIYAGVIWKYLFQRFAERRGANDQSRPLFIFADESQFFITPNDAEFQTTARSSRCATVFLTQNLPNYYSATGASQKSRSDIDSLMGNLQTKIFHQNGDKETNTWASDTIGKAKQSKSSTSSNVTFEGGGTSGTSTSEHTDYLIQPNEFLKLAKGGTSNNFVVTGLLFQSGRDFGGLPFLHIAFNQKAKI